MATVYAVAIPYQISRCSVIWKGFDDLLRRPLGRVGCSVTFKCGTAATFMRQHGKNEQYSQVQCGNGEKVDDLSFGAGSN